MSENDGRREPTTWVPPGHFYSPLVNLDELDARRSWVFDRDAEPAGVALNIAGQLATLERLAAHRDGIRLTVEQREDRRFYLNNRAFNCADAWALAAMLVDVRPARIVEIGSGYSSALTMDICEEHLGGKVELTFVEPYPKLLRELMRHEDRVRYTVVESPVQDIDPAVIDKLEPNDVLFIDSTHVAKAGSDVMFEFFDLLPRLKPGVLVHIHDIFYPFEYPEDWFFKENRSWNEAYVLRALLTGNDDYEILLWNHYLSLHHAERLRKAMPAGLPIWGGSIWLRVRERAATVRRVKVTAAKAAASNFWDAQRNAVHDEIEQVPGASSYEVQEGSGYRLAGYLNNGRPDYETYRRVQDIGNRVKLTNVYARPWVIDALVGHARKYLGPVRSVLCHGTRNGAELAWFRERLPSAEIVGTDIANSATTFADTIQWDFHDFRQDWGGYWDVIYSNSWDHALEPARAFATWAKSLRPGGILYLEHGPGHDEVDKLDLFAATPEALTRFASANGMLKPMRPVRVTDNDGDRMLLPFARRRKYTAALYRLGAMLGWR